MARAPPRDERLSTPLLLLKHTQGIVTTATAIGILHLRTCHALYFTACSLATSFTAKGLKLIIRQPRPVGSKVKNSSGMPSTHSATMSFMGTYILLCSLMLPLHPSLPSSRAGSESATRAWLTILAIGTPVTVMWSRVRLGVHTPAQTLAGAALGIFKGCLWFTLWNGTERTLGIRLGDGQHGWTGAISAGGFAEHVGVPVDSFISSVESSLLRWWTS